MIRTLALLLLALSATAADIVLYSTTAPAARGPCLSIVPRTGQTNVYAAGVDDGSLQTGMPWPTLRFGKAGEGAATNQVRDYLTGLTWAADASLLSTNWFGAIYYITNVMNTANYGGTNDWRLPNVREMFSLFSHQFSAPALCNSNNTAKWAAGNSPFRGVLGSGQPYWSATTSVSIPARALYAEFVNGSIAVADKTTFLTAYFIAVRGRPELGQ